MEQPNQFKPTVGIIGGGQLALLLVHAAKKVNVNSSVFVSSDDEPAVRFADTFAVGTLQRPTFTEWLSQIDVLTFENEFVNCDDIETAIHNAGDAREATGRARTLECFPSLLTIKQLQNKLFQKQLLYKLGIATSPFVYCEASEKREVFLQRAFTVLGARCVLKWANFGYDGKGVFVARKQPSLQSGATVFLQQAQQKNTTVYAEEFVNHSCEVAMVASRCKNGDMVFYPLVHSKQAAGICSQVVGPAEYFGIKPEFVEKAQSVLKRVGNATQFVGSFAVEFFVTPEGELLVNEIAPRVHNTGHYTLNACATSQFENHLRAVLGLELGPTTLSRKYFGMHNILGSRTTEPSETFLAPAAASKDLSVYWYGKNRLSPGRKMGHINVTAHTRHELFHQLEQASAFIKQWELSIPCRNQRATMEPKA